MKIRDPLLLALIAGGQVELHTLPDQLTGPRLYQLSQGAEPETPEEIAFLRKRMMDNPPQTAPRQADAFPIEADYQITYDRGDY
jgi:hypothetical protein